MRRLLSASAFAGVLVLAACGSDGSFGDTPPDDLESADGSALGDAATGGDGSSLTDGGAEASTDANADDAAIDSGLDAGADAATPPVCKPPPDPVNGAPVTAPDQTWTWVPVPGAHCRDGSPTGFGIRKRAGSTRLFIYLEGGGACFNTQSCLANPAKFGSADFDGWKAGGAGVLDFSNPANPLRDWNAIYVPYCTGDVHAGNNASGDVPLGPQNQQFVGYANMGHFLKRIVPTFPGVTQVLVTGVSAGGFGAAFNYNRVAQDFCPRRVDLIDDSGPPLSDTYVAPCLQQRWRTLWNLNATLPADCAACTGPNGGGLGNYVPYLTNRYKSSRLGLISSVQDSVITLFFGYGSNNCATLDLAPTPMSGAQYRAGLLELRSKHLQSSSNWGSYYIDSTQHTWIGGSSFYTTSVGGTSLVNWVGTAVNTGALKHVGP